jgi:hypothetical protein
VVDEMDIWCAAQVLVKGYGEDAGFETAKRVAAMFKACDPDGAAVWQRILRAVATPFRNLRGLVDSYELDTLEFLKRQK